jgi:peptidoglycan/xylan/chitin deacetylase (PgdA/CDA1 family)
MAITFDDLPVHNALPPGETRLQVANAILAALAAERMPPTYGFINGATANDIDTVSVLRAWRDAGQPLGNHTWAHRDFNDLTVKQFEAQITKNEPLLKEYMDGEDWHWFRYPYLHEGQTAEKVRPVREWLQARGYKIAQVTMSFEDYAGRLIIIADGHPRRRLHRFRRDELRRVVLKLLDAVEQIRLNRRGRVAATLDLFQFRVGDGTCRNGSFRIRG